MLPKNISLTLRLYLRAILTFFGFSYSVENAYMEEKEDTINSFVEIVENIGWVLS